MGEAEAEAQKNELAQLSEIQRSTLETIRTELPSFYTEPGPPVEKLETLKAMLERLEGAGITNKAFGSDPQVQALFSQIRNAQMAQVQMAVGSSRNGEQLQMASNLATSYGFTLGTPQGDEIQAAIREQYNTLGIPQPTQSQSNSGVMSETEAMLAIEDSLKTNNIEKLRSTLQGNLSLVNRPFESGDFKGKTIFQVVVSRELDNMKGYLGLLISLNAETTTQDGSNFTNYIQNPKAYIYLIERNRIPFDSMTSASMLENAMIRGDLTSFQDILGLDPSVTPETLTRDKKPIFTVIIKNIINKIHTQFLNVFLERVRQIDLRSLQEKREFSDLFVSIGLSVATEAIVKYFIGNGYDLARPFQNGSTTLHHAVENRFPITVIEMILDSGVPKDISNKEGLQAAQVAETHAAKYPDYTRQVQAVLARNYVPLGLQQLMEKYKIQRRFMIEMIPDELVDSSTSINKVSNVQLDTQVQPPTNEKRPGAIQAEFPDPRTLSKLTTESVTDIQRVERLYRATRQKNTLKVISNIDTELKNRQAELDKYRGDQSKRWRKRIPILQRVVEYLQHAQTKLAGAPPGTKARIAVFVKEPRVYAKTVDGHLVGLGYNTGSNVLAIKEIEGATAAAMGRSFQELGLPSPVELYFRPTGMNGLEQIGVIVKENYLDTVSSFTGEAKAAFEQDFTSMADPLLVELGPKDFMDVINTNTYKGTPYSDQVIAASLLRRKDRDEIILVINDGRLNEIVGSLKKEDWMKLYEAFEGNTKEQLKLRLSKNVFQALNVTAANTKISSNQTDLKKTVNTAVAEKSASEPTPTLNAIK